MLFNEPKLLKWYWSPALACIPGGFSALQRAEIAEIGHAGFAPDTELCFSALQRAEIAEINRENFPCCNRL